MSELFRATVYNRSNFRDLLSLNDAAELCNIEEKKLLEYSKSGFAPCVVIDNDKYLFFKKDIFNWTLENMVKVQDGKKVVYPVIVEKKANPFDVPFELCALSEKLFELSNKEIPCIYFLVDKDKIVYVGQSISLHDRISNHRQHKNFDRVFYMVVPRDLLNKIERSFIKYLRPSLNGAFVDAEFCEESKQTLENLGMKLLIEDSNECREKN